ncbi:oxidoreductase [Desulfosarcina ovata subsp. sediminis]|uniref:Oxidoreductase n=1 Tax=Desulfosarcina ovata subsp. sediminis TaxID=885957 RepID=A0A5K7ZNG4_9BACT|nr:xanthine dehydrogenase family protein subunit M [Desulfosarcina ovata]BBO82065.1 oxidoreductase [Desulfosarcina ovata subsp. sediminis]
MKDFNHDSARTVDEAIELLKNNQGRAKLIAGGTDLLGELKDKVLPTYPEALVNIKTIPDMDYIKEESGGLKIGALTKLREIVTSPLVQESYNILALAAHSVGSPQIRNMGTIGGNLCQDTRCWYYRYPHQIGGRIVCRRKGDRGPCLAVKGDNRYHAIMGGKKCFAVCPSDTATALVALGATMKIVGPGGDRTIPVGNFYNPLGNDLCVDEIVTEIQVPRPSVKAKQNFLKFTLRKPIDFAIVSVASVIRVEAGVCRDASIALGAVAPAPIRATAAEEMIKEKIIDDAIAESAAEMAVTGAKPLSMNAYKVEITKTLVKRAILS